MQVDEKIAVLERMRRQEEKARAEEQNTAKLPEKEKLTIEQALSGIDSGKLILDDGSSLEFEDCIYFKENIAFVIFKNFYDASQEEESGLIMVSHDKNVSQIMSWAQGSRKAKTLKQWTNLLVNGMAANGMSAKIVKRAELDEVEYFCYEVPTGKGMLWNIMFRFKNRWKDFAGSYNCMKKDVDIYGTCLEAMVLHLNAWAGAQEKECTDGAGEQNK